jgi:hypothetical protein
VLAGLRIESVIKRRIGSQFGIEGVALIIAHNFQRWITHAQLAVVPDSQFAAYLKRNSGECLMRAHVASNSIFALEVIFVCDVSTRVAGVLA